VSCAAGRPPSARSGPPRGESRLLSQRPDVGALQGIQRPASGITFAARAEPRARLPHHPPKGVSFRGLGQAGASGTPARPQPVGADVRLPSCVSATGLGASCYRGEFESCAPPASSRFGVPVHPRSRGRGTPARLCPRSPGMRLTGSRISDSVSGISSIGASSRDAMTVSRTCPLRTGAILVLESAAVRLLTFLSV
jgi:hypothetical protein